jgi:UDP-N-acetylmuramate dehydrogenase
MPGRVLEDPKNDDAAMLIREAGLCGVRLRGARIGQIESNAVVNLGGSSAKDLWLLLQMIRDRVKLHSGVQLQPALRRIGEEK